jgi:hypothetical protein
MTESNLVNSCLDYLAKRQVFAWRNNTGAFAGEYKGKTRFFRYGAKGSPDILGIIRGRFFGIECKVGRNKLSEDQAEFHRQILKAGGIVFTVRSLDECIEAVEDALSRLR